MGEYLRERIHGCAVFGLAFCVLFFLPFFFGGASESEEGEGEGEGEETQEFVSKKSKKQNKKEICVFWKLGQNLLSNFLKLIELTFKKCVKRKYL